MAWNMSCTTQEPARGCDEDSRITRGSFELDGDRAPRTSVFRYRSVPAGDYEVRSVLLSTRGQERAMVSQTVTVLGAGGR